MSRVGFSNTAGKAGLRCKLIRAAADILTFFWYLEVHEVHARLEALIMKLTHL
jgi:hypothetical protein